MMNVHLIYVGKLKEDYLKKGCDEYIKRLNSLCKLTTWEIAEEKISANPSQKEIERVLQKEGERILEKIPSGAFIVPMCIEGKQVSSTAFAEKIDQIAVSGKSAIAFIIGGSYGLSDQVKNMADLKMSISPMTFPHQLARMILLEQIYRGFSINNGSKYHK